MSNSFPHRGIVRDADLQREYGLSRTTAWRLSKSDSSFPRKVRLTGVKATGYLRHELDEYFAKQPRVATN